MLVLIMSYDACELRLAACVTTCLQFMVTKGNLGLYFFIATQTAQVSEPIWIALAGQLGQSRQQWRSTPLVKMLGSHGCSLSHPIDMIVLPQIPRWKRLTLWLAVHLECIVMLYRTQRTHSCAWNTIITSIEHVSTTNCPDKHTPIHFLCFALSVVSSPPLLSQHPSPSPPFTCYPHFSHHVSSPHLFQDFIFLCMQRIVAMRQLRLYLLVLILPKLPHQCYSNRLGNLGNLGTI